MELLNLSEMYWSICHWFFCLFNQFYFVSGDPNGWKLSRIEEVDHETPV